ncbi:unnamed protein product [Spodoptera exigua]|nr:unnamed protein product [Spodoptera exigua]
MSPGFFTMFTFTVCQWCRNNFFFFKKNLCPTLGFSPMSWVRLQTYNFTYT